MSAVTPYNGTSGWSGSDTSRERAESADSTGKTAHTQIAALTLLHANRSAGLTWKDLSDALRVHHGSASGALSVLHKVGKIARLRNVRRNRCAVYVMPEWTLGREVEEHGSRQNKLSRIKAEFHAALDELDAEGNGFTPVVLTTDEIRALVERLFGGAQ